MPYVMNALLPIGAVAAALLLAVVLAWLLRKVIIRVLDKVPSVREVTKKARNPLWLVLAIIGVRVALGFTVRDTGWFPVVDRLLVFALIGAVAWLAIAVSLIVEAGALAAFRRQSADKRRYRRLKTQVTLGRRIIAAVIITVAVAAILLTIPEVRALGAGILASAGLISVVAGLAVQSSLANVFAGVQLAFTDAIRVGDSVLVEDELGTIEEITMTYIVVAIWDERRMILPSTYFTTTPFQNWTRTNSELLGTVEFDLDWHTPVAELREHFNAVLEKTDLWDRRASSFVVTGAVDGVVRVRAMVSAQDDDDIWSLRCLVREEMISYLQRNHPQAFPRRRWETVADDAVAPGEPGV
ncbi:mechanosensitive ion channel family protein [Arthrobacter roseus]|uniref:mechanosensitive ion channel family protein n=1 Tax=Arthrobacter roseus TaxID=136274 RepID=UPI0019651CF0|nr:mechanosensitive ion channel family protein [Arthrobacter roseus]MBM7849757.1 small-conductance mechanosensitive channel [Arthrobacter roseus]